MFSKGLQNEIYDLNSYMKRWGLWAISGSRNTLWGRKRLLYCVATLWGRKRLFHCVASLGRKLLYTLQGIYYRFGVFDITTLTFRNIIFRMFQNFYHIAAIENIGYIREK